MVLMSLSAEQEERPRHEEGMWTSGWTWRLELTFTHYCCGVHSVVSDSLRPHGL